MYFFYQATPTSVWDVALASERANVIKDNNPEFASILDVDNAFRNDLTFEETLAVKYAGPMYVDFDGREEDLEVVIAQFQSFLNKLRERKLDFSMVSMYASGGRGFHLTIPMQVLVAKPSPQGVAGLPWIYRELAYDLYVETLDLRVYSAGRGRMWRLPNFKRANGKYKVQITVDEADAMTPELYEQICSSPRAPLPVDPPVFNGQMGLLFSMAKDKVDTGVKKTKARKKSAVTLERFNGEWPKPLKTLITEGVGVKDGTGWNRVAMQLCLTAQALGRNEDQLVKDLEPLIETYKGDSQRYGSRRKREHHLRDMYRYLNDNVTYDFDVAGLGSVLEHSVDLAEIECEGYEPDDDQDDDGGAPTDDDETPIPVRVSSKGIWVRTEEGWKRGSFLGLKDPQRLVNQDNKDEGYEVEVFVEGRSKGRVLLPMQSLVSKAQLHNFALAWSTAMSISDVQVGAIADVLRRRTEKKKGAITYVTHREGVDLVQMPGALSEDELVKIWVSPDGVVTDTGLSFRLRSNFAKNGVYRSDLMNAPDLEDTHETRAMIEHLLSVNKPQNVARIFGWFAACFICQLIRHVNSRKFPPMQVFGEAGAGKSETIKMFHHLHYFLRPPKEQMSVGGTTYPAIAACASSASMPVVFEEMKASEMSKARRDFLISIFRSSYDCHSNERGGLSKEGGTKEIVISENELKGPLVFVGESLEDQTAIVERCLIVPLSKADREGRKHHRDALMDHPHNLGSVGKLFVTCALEQDLGEVRETLRKFEKEILSKLASEEMTRPANGFAVILTGLEFAKRALGVVFGDAFNDKIEFLQQSLIDHAPSLMPSNKSEILKVLDVMAQLTRNRNPQLQLERNLDYCVSDDGLTTELNLKQCYYKYTMYERSMGKEPLFQTESKFLNGMMNFAGVTKRACPSSPLYRSPRQVVYAISNAYLDKYQNEVFEP